MLIDSARTYLKLLNTFKVSPFQSHFHQNKFWSMCFGFLLNVPNWSRSRKTLVDLGLRWFCTQLSSQALPARIIPSLRRKKYKCKLLFRKKWKGFRMSSTMGQVQGYAFTSIISFRQKKCREAIHFENDFMWSSLLRWYEWNYDRIYYLVWMKILCFQLSSAFTSNRN